MLAIILVLAFAAGIIFPAVFIEGTNWERGLNMQHRLDLNWFFKERRFKFLTPFLVSIFLTIMGVLVLIGITSLLNSLVDLPWIVAIGVTILLLLAIATTSVGAVALCYLIKLGITHISRRETTPQQRPSPTHTSFWQLLLIWLVKAKRHSVCPIILVDEQNQ